MLFRDWDADRSGRLNRTELLALVGGAWGDEGTGMIAHEREMVLFQVPPARSAAAW